MAENSKIEWTHHTFNPWMGCTKVSDGCKNCYAETLMDTRWGKVQWGPQGIRQRTSDANWKKPLAWNRQAAHEGARYRVFCASLADVFEDNEQVHDWRIDLWDLIKDTPHLDWLLLTKRPENVRNMTRFNFRENGAWQLPSNVWIGTSVENQDQADKRIPLLLNIPAYVRFLSMEPLLGDVALDVGFGQCVECFGSGETAGHYFSDDGIGTCDSCHGSGEDDEAILDWIIVGGESGHNARPMHPDWVRSIRDQCVETETDFFFKQWGEYAPTGNDEGTVWRVGKKKAGRTLDGREWNQFPDITKSRKIEG